MTSHVIRLANLYRLCRVSHTTEQNSLRLYQDPSLQRFPLPTTYHSSTLVGCQSTCIPELWQKLGKLESRVNSRLWSSPPRDSLSRQREGPRSPYGGPVPRRRSRSEIGTKHRPVVDARSDSSPSPPFPFPPSRERPAAPEETSKLDRLRSKMEELLLSEDDPYAANERAWCMDDKLCLLR